MRATVVRGGEAQHVFDAHRAEPLGVAADLEVVVEEDAAGLLDVGGGVGLDLLLREPGPGGRLARRVTDLGGEVADDQHRDVAELLELAQLAQHDREPEVDVGRGRVDAELDPQRTAGAELAPEVGLGDEVDRAGAQDAQLLVDVTAMTRGTLPGMTARSSRLRFGSPGTQKRHGCSSPRPSASPMRARHAAARRGAARRRRRCGRRPRDEVVAVVGAGDAERLAQPRGTRRAGRGRAAPSPAAPA